MACSLRLLLRSFALALSVAAFAPSAHADDTLQPALALAARQDWAAAATAAAPLGPVAADLVEWQRLRAGAGVPADYTAFVARRPDWPGLPLLLAAGERSLPTTMDPAAVVAWFGDRPPRTAAGVLTLARAMAASGQQAAAGALLREHWTGGLAIPAAMQADWQKLAGPALDSAAHEARLDTLLWERQVAAVRRTLPLARVEWQQLAAARLALQEDTAGVDALIAAVPARLAADPGLARDRVEWRARKGLTATAAALLQEHSRDAATLGRPEAWARRRELLARAVLREGDARLAHELAANHHLPPGADQAELEFLAGFIALRFLDQPQAALAHFEQLRRIVRTPISMARGEYWQGRALAALGRDDEARAALTRAAQHQTAYYGLMAAEALGQDLAPELAAPPALPDWRGAGFLRSSVAEAALLLYRGKDAALARRFLLHLAEDRPAEELAALGALALDFGDAHLAVLLGKQAAARSIILPAVYFPDPGALLPADLPVARPLALAIARRESEFLPTAISHAGARGLMQLMPATARQMAAALNLPDRPGALTTDPAYNARLGAGYLAKLAAEFGPSLALQAVGYNAGPGRAREWITRLGDPRQADTDIIDWVELVPFAETRTYIMRVAEGVVIYGARQAGGGPVALTALLRGSED